MNEDLRQSMLRVRDYLSGWPRSVQGVAIVLSAAVAILAMVLAQVDTTETSYEPLFSQLLTPSERQQIDAALGEAELHDLVLRNGRLHGPAGQRSRYAAAINEANCLPDSFYDPTEDAIRNSSIIDLGPRLTQRMHHAREKEAGLAIRGLDGITEAFVFFDETKPRGLREQEVTAVVGVKTSSERSLNAVTLRTIHDMVLRFKAGLQSSQLTVVDLNTGQSFDGSSLAASNAAMTRVIEQRILEGQLHERLSPFLSFVPDVRLAVHVQLPLDNAVVEQSIVRVSVGIPTSYLDHVREARQRHARSNAGESLLTLTQVEQQTRNRIQSAIRPLLPGPPTEDEVKDQVVVTAFEDPAMPATTRAENSWFHTLSANTSWPAVVVPALTVGLMALFLLRAHRHSLNHPPQLTVVTDTEGERDQTTEVIDADTDDAVAREQLQTLVEEDPEAAARSLSGWMNRAS